MIVGAATASRAAEQVNVPRGMRITSATARTFSLTYTPVIERWDTVRIDGRDRLRPLIADAEPRMSRDGSVISWVVRFVLPVPGPDAFHLAGVRTTARVRPLPLAPNIDGKGAGLTTLTPTDPVQVRYTGIARDNHVAEVTLEVARTTGDSTLVRSTTNATIIFDRPFTSVRPAKAADEVQRIERFEFVYRMSIEREGVYRLTADELRSNGIPTDATGARTIRIFGRGGTELPERVADAERDSLIEQPIVVRTNADGSVRDVLFYASGPTGWTTTSDGVRHYIHHYDRTAGYLLTYGGAEGLRAVARPAADGAVDQRPTRTVGRVFTEDELTNPYNSGSGRRWFGRSIENGGSITLTTLLPGLARDGRVDYVVSGAHRSQNTGSITVAEQGNTITQIPLEGVPDYMDTYNNWRAGTIGSSMIPADGRSVLRCSYTSSDRSATGLLDYIEIHYPRELLANDGEFELWSDTSNNGVVEWTVNGFGQEIVAFDVTDRTQPALVTNVASTGGMCMLRERMASGDLRRFFITSNIRNATLDRITWANLRADARNTQLIVITHPALKASAEAFAAYRRSQGELGVTVTTTDLIFNEFSYGVQDPTAIRDYLYHAFTTWSVPPRYVLLWGDGHFDYKNISTAATNYVIPYESEEPVRNSNGLFTHTTDDFFVRLLGEDSHPEVAIGRLPVTSDDVGLRLLGNIRSYEQEASTDDWRTRVTLVADDGQTTETVSDRDLHLSQSETIATSYLPSAFQPRKIYLVEYPTENVPRGRRKPSVTDDLLSTINTQGSLILNWIGHGNPRVWAHEQIFVRENTVPLMTNAAKRFFLTAATCDFARFDLPDNQSGAEDLLLAENGGAIGVFSASRVVLAYSNATINQEFYSNLFRRDEQGRFPRLGDVILRTKQKLSGDNDEKFFLLADPTLRLLTPNDRVVFDSVNGMPVGDTTRIELQALSTVRVSGHVTSATDVDVDATFDGVATVSLFDSDVQLAVRDNDKYATLNSFERPGAALNRSSYRVVDGRFSAEFVIPKDIAFASKPGKLYGYAVNDAASRFAMGVTDRVTVGGVSTETYDDDEGPSIAIFMDSRAFRPGEIVRRNPILLVDLADATGINTTGVGIGHNIEAEIDGGAMVENLTPTFTTSLENSRAGTATKQLFNMTAGTHSVRVRAWDVLNNVAEAVTSFRVVDVTAGSLATSLEAWPNPFQGNTTIVFKHNIDRPFTASLRIHDMSGRRVFERTIEVTAMQTAEIPWDGRDHDGSALSSGTYHGVVVCTLADGSEVTVGGNMTLLR